MNSIYFDSRKYADKFIEFLLDYNHDVTNDDYFEIHIYQEETGIIVEFEKVPHNREWGGRFAYLEEGDEIFTEIRLPDGSYQMVRKGTEEEYLDE